MKHCGLSIVVLLFMFATCRAETNKFQGRYSGDWSDCAGITLLFKRNGRVDCRIHSKEFVGRFSDKVRGEYEKKDNALFIEWTSVDEDNSLYKSTDRIDVDSLRVDEERDVVYLYRTGKKHELSRVSAFGWIALLVLILIVVLLFPGSILFFSVFATLLVARKERKRIENLPE